MNFVSTYCTSPITLYFMFVLCLTVKQLAVFFLFSVIFQEVLLVWMLKGYKNST